MKRAFLLAHPAGHSLSPAMHNAAFAHLGIEAEYVAVDVEPSDLEAAVTDLRRPEVLGANISVPHKQEVIPLLDELSAAARAVGAVNTVVVRRGRLEGYNTDGEGFVRALLEAGIRIEGVRALLLGAGGAARGVAFALLGAGVGALQVFNRTTERAERLAAHFAEVAPISVLRLAALEQALASCDLLVNSTSVGMEHGGVAPDLSPLPAGLRPRHGAVVDIVYRPPRTRLLLDAEAAGLRVQNGVPMLVHQGAVALESWLGQRAPLQVMRTAVEQGLAAGT
jgi:shikimate dehydrogenase